MRVIKSDTIYQSVKEIIKQSQIYMSDDLQNALDKAYNSESNACAKFALDILLKNGQIAKRNHRPLCQDTGMAMFFVEIGQDVHIEGAHIEDTLNAAVKDVFHDEYFRKSVLDPITRKNTLDNTPSIVHYEIVKGDKLHITFMPKGFGSENMTRTYMLTPDRGIDGIAESVLDTVRCAGSSPCPPIIVGVGIGGTLDKAALLAKKALLRPIEQFSQDKNIAKLEKQLLEKINQIGIGVLGYGGNNTALGVHIETYPTHIAGLPICVSLQCHSKRQGEILL